MASLPPGAPAPSEDVTHLMSGSEELLRLPMMLWIAWWNATVDAWCPECQRHPHDHLTHDLNVPEPIEAEDKHTLFA